MKKILFFILLLSFIGCTEEKASSNNDNNSNLNDCGGTVVLADSVGTACGACGSYICDGLDAS